MSLSVAGSRRKSAKGAAAPSTMLSKYAAALRFAGCCPINDLLFWQRVESTGVSHLTDFNHIHSRDGDDWVCGRSMSVRDEQLLHCEGRDPEEIEACRLCAERIISYFGDPMHVH
jgi:hypothetical protein